MENYRIVKRWVGDLERFVPQKLTKVKRPFGRKGPEEFEWVDFEEESGPLG